MYLGCVALAYMLRFTEATHAIVRSLSNVKTGRGFQDAISPPKIATIGFSVSALCLIGIIYGLWKLGWRIGDGVFAAFIVSKIINMRFFSSQRWQSTLQKNYCSFIVLSPCGIFQIWRCDACVGIDHALWGKLGIPVDQAIEA